MGLGELGLGEMGQNPGNMDQAKPLPTSKDKHKIDLHTIVTTARCTRGAHCWICPLTSVGSGEKEITGRQLQYGIAQSEQLNTPLP